MPFVTIRILRGHAQDRKDEIARRVTGAISDVTGLRADQIWVTVEEIAPSDWWVGGVSVEHMKTQANNN